LTELLKNKETDIFRHSVCYLDVYSSEDEGENESSDALSDCDDIDKDSAVFRERHKTTRLTGPNGHRPIDLRPPEKLLKRAEKKVARHIERKQVI